MILHKNIVPELTVYRSLETFFVPLITNTYISVSCGSSASFKLQFTYLVLLCSNDLILFATSQHQYAAFCVSHLQNSGFLVHRSAVLRIDI